MNILEMTIHLEHNLKTTTHIGNQIINPNLPSVMSEHDVPMAVSPLSVTLEQRLKRLRKASEITGVCHSQPRELLFLITMEPETSSISTFRVNQLMQPHKTVFEKSLKLVRNSSIHPFLSPVQREGGGMLFQQL